MKICSGWCKLRHVHVNWKCIHSPRRDYNKHTRTRRKRGLEEDNREKWSYCQSYTEMYFANYSYNLYLNNWESEANKHRLRKQCSTQIHTNIVRRTFSSSSIWRTSTSFHTVSPESCLEHLQLWAPDYPGTRGGARREQEGVHSTCLCVAVSHFSMLFMHINCISGLSRLIHVTKTTGEMSSMLIDVWGRVKWWERQLVTCVQNGLTRNFNKGSPVHSAYLLYWLLWGLKVHCNYWSAKFTLVHWYQQSASACIMDVS